MVAAMIQQIPSATAPARIAAATLRSSAICRQRSNGAIRTNAAAAPTNTAMPRQAKIRALSTGTSVMPHTLSVFLRGPLRDVLMLFEPVVEAVIALPAAQHLEREQPEEQIVPGAPVMRVADIGGVAFRAADGIGGGHRHLSP